MGKPRAGTSSSPRWPISALVMAPTLLLTILLGPIGLLAYLLIRLRFASRDRLTGTPQDAAVTA